MQRHHLLPRQLLSQKFCAQMFGELGREQMGFDDFRSNGLLLPANEAASVRLGMPLHRGPHRVYNEVVAGRMGQIEAGWAQQRTKSAVAAADQAMMRISLLQSALRRRLLQQRKRKLLLNSKDPLGQGVDFSMLDAMAEALWADTVVIDQPIGKAC